MLLELFAHAHAVVGDGELIPGIVALAGDLFDVQRDMPAGLGVLDCVGEDVQQHLLQTGGITFQIFVPDGVGLDDEPLAAGPALGTDDVLDLGDLVSHAEGCNVQSGLAALDFVHVQYLVDEVQQVLTGTFQLAEIFLYLLRVARVGLHQAGEAHDGVHGGADVVAHVGEKICLGLAGHLGGLQGFGSGRLSLFQLLVGPLQFGVGQLHLLTAVHLDGDLPLLLHPHHHKDTDAGDDDHEGGKQQDELGAGIHQGHRVDSHVFRGDDEQKRPFGILQPAQGVVILRSVQHSIGEGRTGLFQGGQRGLKGGAMPVLCIFQGSEDIISLQQIVFAVVEQFVAVVIQNVGRVVGVVGIAFQIGAECIHIHRDACIGDLGISAVPGKRRVFIDPVEKIHPGLAVGKGVAHIADALRGIEQIRPLCQHSLPALCGIVVTLTVYRKHIGLLCVHVGNIVQISELVHQLLLGGRAGQGQRPDLDVCRIPLALDDIFQAGEKLHRNFPHLALPLLIEQVVIAAAKEIQKNIQCTGCGKENDAQNKKSRFTAAFLWRLFHSVSSRFSSSGYLRGRRYQTGSGRCVLHPDRRRRYPRPRGSLSGRRPCRSTPQYRSCSRPV